MSAAKTRILYVASNNRHKVDEIRAMVGPGWDVKTAKDASSTMSWEETGTTFLENARIKAHAVRALTPHCVLADDSGLQVAALQGAPGVTSSSYAGVEGDDAANNAKLLRAMRDIPDGKRAAQFVCTLLFIDESGEEHVFTGECHGNILTAPRGSNGFGYDPLFEVTGQHGRSLAELTDAEKNRVSHRFQAMAKWNDFIARL